MTTSDEESSAAAVSRVLKRETGEAPSAILVMQLIDAVRRTTSPPQEVTIGLLSKLLRSLEPSRIIDAWATRSSREIVQILSRHPKVQQAAELVDDERLWCALEGTIAGMLVRVCRGQDLEEAPADPPSSQHS